MTTVPAAGVPSARYTVSLMVVSAGGDCARETFDDASESDNRPIRMTSVIAEQRFRFLSKNLGISFVSPLSTLDLSCGPIRKWPNKKAALPSGVQFPCFCRPDCVSLVRTPRFTLASCRYESTHALHVHVRKIDNRTPCLNQDHGCFHLPLHCA